MSKEQRFNKFKELFLRERLLPEDQVVGGVPRVRIGLRPDKDIGEVFNWYEEEIIPQVELQTRNDLLREIMEEMPKKLSEDTKFYQKWSRLHGFNSCHDQVNTLLERKLSTVKKI